MSIARVWRPSELKTYEKPLLLDTHIWIWYLEGDGERLSPSLVQLLDRVAQASALYVSDISHWEIGVKAAKGQLTFTIDAAVWLRRAESAPGTRSLPLDRETLLLSTRLFGSVHNDPADRMLIAAAKLHNLPLVTADARIIEYAQATGGTPVVDARAD